MNCKAFVKYRSFFDDRGQTWKQQSCRRAYEEQDITFHAEQIRIVQHVMDVSLEAKVEPSSYDTQPQAKRAHGSLEDYNVQEGAC